MSCVVYGYLYVFDEDVQGVNKIPDLSMNCYIFCNIFVDFTDFAMNESKVFARATLRVIKSN